MLGDPALLCQRRPRPCHLLAQGGRAATAQEEAQGIPGAGLYVMNTAASYFLLLLCIDLVTISDTCRAPSPSQGCRNRTMASTSVW